MQMARLLSNRKFYRSISINKLDEPKYTVTVGWWNVDMIVNLTVLSKFRDCSYLFMLIESPKVTFVSFWKIIYRVFIMFTHTMSKHNKEFKGLHVACSRCEGLYLLEEDSECQSIRVSHVPLQSTTECIWEPYLNISASADQSISSRRMYQRWKSIEV